MGDFGCSWYRAVVLLDQQRTRKMTRIVAIIMVVGLVGVLPIALGMIIFSDDGQQASATTLIQDAEARVAKNPRDVIALVALAAQYQSAGRNKESADTLAKAADIGPSNIDTLRTLVGAYGSDTGRQAEIIKAYLKTHQRDAQAWLLSGTVAANTGDVLGARLAYQRVLSLVKPDSATGQSAQAGLDSLQSITPDQIVPTTPTTN